MAALLTVAESLALGKGATAGERPPLPRIAPAALVFDRIFASSAASLGHRLNPLSLRHPALLDDRFFPVAAASHDDVHAAMAASLQEAGHALPAPSNSADALITNLLAWMHMHTWAVAGDGGGSDDDVPLSEHAKTAAAVAASLYCYYQEQGMFWSHDISMPEGNEFCLLTGDFSGIQDYIFDIATGDGAGKGVARRLRARSFAVQALAESVAYSYIEAAGLTVANIIVASGGKFQVLLPNVPSLLDKLKALGRQWDNWFLETYRGELSLNLAWRPFGRESLIVGPNQGFGAVLAAAAGQLRQVKARRLAAHLIGEGGWQEDRFVMGALPVAPCTSCKKFARQADGLCVQCLHDLDWGRRLPNAKALALVRTAGAPGSSGRPLDAHLVGGGALPAATALTITLNDPAHAPTSPGGTVFRYLVNHVPTGPDGDLLDFREIAAKSKGRELLGFLKLDVDRLGETFAFGLRGADSLARLATLSRTLDLFFSGWVEHLLETEFADCYAVFSGGDDVFVVGPWDQTLRLARRIADDFARFTGNNPHMTISGGLAFGGDRFPIGQAAREAGYLVELSKIRGRDRFTVLGHTLKWTKMRDLLTIWEAMLPEVERTELSQGFLHALVRYGEMWKPRAAGRQPDLRFQPMLAYSISREGATPAFRRWAEQFIGIRPLGEEQRFLLDHLSLLAQLWIYAKRGRRA
ncbi:MAG: hypothetical protein NTZ05_05030 [Chloroflexi bacterium]|nr:hypothetical protein [Chloroflexota bacterium]